MFKFLSKLTGASPSDVSATDGGKPTYSEGEPVSVEEYSTEVVDSMAEEMSPEQGVDWAARSSRLVEDRLPPEDVKAIKAAESWKAAPSEQLADAAAREANKAGFQGPGAWAAQAASFATEAVGSATKLLSKAGSPPLVAKAVSGAVKLAAAATMESPPPAAAETAADTSKSIVSIASEEAVEAATEAVDPAQHAKALKPFIDLGKQIMSEAPTG